MAEIDIRKDPLCRKIVAFENIKIKRLNDIYEKNKEITPEVIKEVEEKLREDMESYEKEKGSITCWMDFGEDFGEPKEESQKNMVLMTKFSPVPFAEELMRGHTFILDKNSLLWRYDKEEGLWKPKAEQFIRTNLRLNLMGDEQQKKNYIDEIINHIKDITFNDSFEMDNNPNLIAFKNRVYDLSKDKFIDFSPELYLTNKLNLEIDPEIKECPLIDRFFSESIGEEHKQILYDLFAYTLYKYIPYHKIFFIYGPAGTGKSVCLSLLEEFLGTENKCSVEPRQIQKDKHATFQMLYKLANIVSDINYDEFDNINLVKKLSGNDTISVRQMYKEAYDAKIFAKQIYSTNKLPVIREKTNAWYRRVYLIEFSNIIPSNERDPFLFNKMCSPQEMKGLAYKCLESLKELYKNKFIFTWDIDESKMGELYEELSNPILMFINETCDVGVDKWTFKYEFEERLNNWLKTNHFPIHTKTQINQYMREHYGESNRPNWNGSKTYRVWTGLKWKSGDSVGLFNHFNHFNTKIKRVYIYRGSFTNPCKSVNSVKSTPPQEIEVS